MGLFDFLFGSKQPALPHLRHEQIWLTQMAKWNAVQMAVGEFGQSEAVALFLISHFPESLYQCSKIAATHEGEGTVAALLADQLSTDLAKQLHLTSETLIEFVVVERHPLMSVDEKLVAFASALPCRCRMTHHISLEDALLAQFAGDWVKSVLKSLGMQEDESIESDLVRRRIQQAQKRIEQRAIGNSPADSAAEWLQKNVPHV